jgi:hypothetical protein
VIDKFWFDLHKERHTWAYDAYSAFVESIDAELKADYQRSDQVTVALYGSTQVGKTTLILNMLGISEEHLELVSHVLRGGRSVGKSSTATALRYRKSDDALWHVGDTERGQTDREVEEYFGNLRAEMEAGRRQIPDVLDVYIPRQYFSEAADALRLDIRLLDLPGLNAANANEVEYVRRVAQQYVPFADLIVLVGRADDLGFINPVALQLPELQDWVLYPRRFRIVCTYSFSSASFREWFGERHRTADEVKARLMCQLKTHDYPLPPELQQFVYPLEFGASWNDLKRSRGEYFERAQQVVKELRWDFIEGVRKAANRYSRMQMVFDLQKIADGKIRSFTDKSEKHIERLNKEVSASDAQLTACEAEIRCTDKRIKSLSASDARLTALISDSDSLDAVLGRAFLEEEAIPKKPAKHIASALMEEARRCREVLVSLWNNFPDGADGTSSSHPRSSNENLGAESESENLLPSLGNVPSLRMISDYIDKLDGYWIDRYMPGLSGFDNDHSMLELTIMQAVGACMDSARTSIVKHWRQESAELRGKIVSLDRSKVALEARRESLKALLQTKRMELESLRLAGEEFERRMKHSIDHGKRFRSHMRQAHLDCLTEVEREFRDEPNAVRQFYLLAFRHLIEPEFEKLMNGANQ